MIDKFAKAKVRKLILESVEGLEGELTDNVNDKLDDLLQAMIDDIGYIKLMKLGVNHGIKKKSI